MGHVSRPQNNTGKHLTFNSSTVTSSHAAPANFPEHSIKGTIVGFLVIFADEQAKFLADINLNILQNPPTWFPYHLPLIPYYRCSCTLYVLYMATKRVHILEMYKKCFSTEKRNSGAPTRTSRMLQINEVRLRSEYNLLDDDSKAVNVSCLSSVDRSNCHTK